jgi:hypothetical protein
MFDKKRGIRESVLRSDLNGSGSSKPPLIGEEIKLIHMPRRHRLKIFEKRVLRKISGQKRINNRRLKKTT